MVVPRVFTTPDRAEGCVQEIESGQEHLALLRQSGRQGNKNRSVLKTRVQELQLRRQMNPPGRP